MNPPSASPGAAPLRAISSMATRQLLAELFAAHAQRSGQAVSLEAVGGVDAAKRVQAGEAFDVVILAADALDKLIAGGHVLPGRVDLVNSGVAVAVRQGEPLPDLSSAQAFKATVLAAPSLGYSTGPSGTALLELFKRWGIFEALEPRLVQARPGVPVGSLVASGEVALGVQQLSELIAVQGITLAGPLPAEIQINTVFSAGIAATSQRAHAVRNLLNFLASPETLAAKQRQGMDGV
jgi:molybdate transport system substrate-binding protein